MSAPTFALRPIPSQHAAALRQRGGAVYVADTHPGFPCRQCLRDGEIGDEMLLVSHDPFATDSPYRSASPIFLHRHDCSASVHDGPLPSQLTGRQLSVRAFDGDELMIDAAVIDGQELETTIDRFFLSSATERIHIHNAGRGCFAVAVERAVP